MTQDRIPLDAGSSRPAMEGETNELDARGLLYAETAVHFAGDDADAKALAEAAIRAYRKHSALPSAPAVEGVEPVIWVSEGQLHAMSPDCDDDSASGRYLPMRRSEGGNFKFPLYPASAISRLVKERDEAREGGPSKREGEAIMAEAAAIARAEASEAALAIMAQRARQEERVRVLEEALRPFSIIAGELFARNFNRKDKVYSIQGISPDGFPVELSLLFEAFLNAHAALGNGGGDA